ncbi:MarR family winged helix-turn-helix transcriptional regulator [Nocardioides sp. TF02-7]|uniref:MarR family winged helix-turn-helix transcriptional regulator n=1 Tax=Nocardioides sp. TF02-7 TaxID=2917724 RepID=UPI001F06E0D2|nr:MarR family winged helix-turn-helix transcriptional regulator [Nocardioides sp. TF02-7]UMG91916.1 MarR family winged helix-turn-helix transcriptional regulator [Nocardioides sp. TF02-7]
MDRLGNLLGALSLTVSDRLAAVGRGHGLSVTDQAALVTLLAEPGRTVSWLGEVLSLTSSGATRLVDRLVAAGWVARSPGADSRQRRLLLTAAGTAVAQEVVDDRAAVLADCLGPLDGDDRARLERLLERLVGGSASDLVPALRTCRLCDRPACRSNDRDCPLAHTRAEEPVG